MKKLQELIGRAQEAIELVWWALVCLFQTITGQETTCPDCWKCTAIRWGVFFGILLLLYWMFGWLFIFGCFAVLALLIWKGKGPWERVRWALDEFKGLFKK